MDSENQTTLVELYQFLQANQQQTSERFDALEKQIENLNRRHDEIMTAVEALFSNNRNDFSYVEAQLKILEAKILKACGNIDVVPGSEAQ